MLVWALPIRCGLCPGGEVIEVLIGLRGQHAVK